MRQITTVKNQTIFDLAVQEYGNIELAFQILEDNDLSGLNDFPSGHTLTEGCDFDLAYPIKEGVIIEIQDTIDGENKNVANQLETVIS
jgi:hypothetical protein